MAAPSAHKTDIVVVGAGVIGLTTALVIQQQGTYNVTVVASVLPTDPKTILYTSQWAGAHHVLNPIVDVQAHKLDTETFDVMWKLSAPGSEAEDCFLRVPQTEYYFDERMQPEPLEVMPNFKRLSSNELIPGAVSGITFTTVTIDTPVYLRYLFEKLLSAGAKFHRATVQHVNALVEGGHDVLGCGESVSPPAALVVCAGLGARFLGGVEDKAVYPVRGQTVLVRAPWLRFGRTESWAGSAVTYIIPRRSSDVIVGGTRVADDWYPSARTETTRDILTRGLALCPELVSPEIRAERAPTIEDIQVIEEGCGLRPARRGGVRLEIEWTEGVGGRGRVPIIYNYGHGGYGFQGSWGSANVALRLLDEALAESVGASGY